MKITPANAHRAPEQDSRVIAVAAPSPRHGQIATIAFLFVALFLMVFWAGKSFGQAAPKYDVAKLPPKLEDPKVVKQVEMARRQMASRRNADKSSQEWAYFKGYYTVYIFQRMTLPEARGELSEIVTDILKDLNRSQRSNATAAPYILEWSTTNAYTVAKGNFHPAARINATILLGNLDEKPAVNSGTPPTPSVAAYARLKALWLNEENPDGVRAAALQGLRRWVAHGFRRLDSNADEKKKIQDSMFQLATAAPPAGRDPAAHGFMQRYAVDILYVLNDASSAQKLTDTLIALSSDPDTDPVISLYAAQKLAVIGEEIRPITKPGDIAKAWSSKAADIFGEQSVHLAAMERPKPVTDQPKLVDPDRQRGRGMGTGGTYAAGGYGGEEGYDGGYDGGPAGYDGGYDGGTMGGMETYDGGGGYGPGGYGMAFGGRGRAANPQPIEVIAARRKLNHALQSLNHGLTGSASLAPAKKPAGVVQATAEADRAVLQQLVDAIAAAVETVNDPQYDTREKFVEMVEKEADALRKLSRRLGADPADAAPGGIEPPSPDVAFSNPTR